jgi:hypothetical protein
MTDLEFRRLAIAPDARVLRHLGRQAAALRKVVVHPRKVVVHPLLRTLYGLVKTAQKKTALSS